MTLSGKLATKAKADDLRLVFTRGDEGPRRSMDVLRICVAINLAHPSVSLLAASSGGKPTRTGYSKVCALRSSGYVGLMPCKL